MTVMSGDSFRGRKSGAIEPVGDLTLGRLMLLLALGAGVVVMEDLFRFALKLPGHHGLEAMALLAFARLSCHYRWSASIAAIGSAATAAALGVGHGALTPFLYLLPGLVIDVGVMLVPAWRRGLLWLPLFAAFGYAAKPALKWFALQGIGMEFGSLVNGLAYPLSMHLVFGFTGALVATVAWKNWPRQNTG
jgi:hypothetical protein